MFSSESFVAECRAALDDEDPVHTVQQAVLAALSEGPDSIDAALGSVYKPGPQTLFASPELTVQRLLWPPGYTGLAHEHRMWAVVGVYRGVEKNHFFGRSQDRLEAVGDRSIAEGEVLALDDAAIHSVENTRRGWTAGLHVYGGDIVGAKRSAWGPAGREAPFAEVSAANMAMYQGLYDLVAELGIELDDEIRYVATTALRAACEREQRYLTAGEARQVIADAWGTSP